MTPRAAPRRAGRPRDDAIDAVVLRAARELLSTDGYDRMTIDSVARAAGVTRPTVYRRWPSKAQLAIAAVADMVGETRHAPTGDTRADILDIAQSLDAGFRDLKYLGLLGTAIVEREQHPEIFQLFRENLVAPRRHSVRAVLEHGVTLGQVRADVDVEVVVAMLVGAFYAGQLAGDPDSRHSWARRVTDAVIHLVSSPSHTARPGGTRVRRQ